MSEPLKIPLCRCEFLQDFTIALGRNLRSCNPMWRSFSARVDHCEYEGESLERLTIWIYNYYRIRVNLTLWEDKTIWTSVALLPVEHGEEFEMGFYPDFDLLNHERIAEALVETESVSTCLCYDKSPEPLLRQIWKYAGEMKIEGVL